MYQALYRKYRPSTFDQVIGQDVIVQTLKNAIKNDKLTHAYLFTGPRGTGKTSTAKILAKTVNCQNLKNFEPCEKCDSCIQITQKQSTDIIEIDAASNNGVDEIRELKSKVNLVPSNSKYKVYIIDEVHMLSSGAFNALLKTLEEPPSHIIFILATTEPHKIPATILSRCQRFDFKKISSNKIVDNLKNIVEKEHISIDEKALEEIAILSKGGMRDSISILDQAISFCPDYITVEKIHELNGTISELEMQQVTELILNNDISNLLKCFDEFDDKGKNLVKIFEGLLLYFRNILVFQLSPHYFEEKEKKYYLSISEKISKEELLEYMKHLTKAISEIKNSDNEKITSEIYLIEMMASKKIFLKKEKLDIEKHAKISKQKESVENTQIKENAEKIIKKQEKTSLSIELLEKVKKIRIENTLSQFNKKLLLDFKSKIDLIKQFLIKEEYSQWVSLVLDGELKAAGKNYLIFVYKDEPMAFLFNQNWQIIEKILEETFHTRIKVVATNLEHWNQIKQEFNTKTKIYKWQEEPDLTNNKNNDQNKIELMFSDIIEYQD